MLVLRNGIEIGRARVTIKDPASPLGTHTYAMRHEPEATARVAMPEGFAYAVSLLLEPGDTMFMTDAPILSENTHQDFTVLSDGAPDT